MKGGVSLKWTAISPCLVDGLTGHFMLTSATFSQWDFYGITPRKAVFACFVHKLIKQTNWYRGLVCSHAKSITIQGLIIIFLRQRLDRLLGVYLLFTNLPC